MCRTLLGIVIPAKAGIHPSPQATFDVARNVDSRPRSGRGLALRGNDMAVGPLALRAEEVRSAKIPRAAFVLHELLRFQAKFKMAIRNRC